MRLVVFITHYFLFVLLPEEDFPDPELEDWFPLPEAVGLLGLSAVGTGFSGMAFSMINLPEFLLVLPKGCCFCLLITNQIYAYK